MERVNARPESDPAPARVSVRPSLPDGGLPSFRICYVVQRGARNMDRDAMIATRNRFGVKRRIVDIDHFFTARS